MERLSKETVTVFAPTDEALGEVSQEACSGVIARHHITSHVLCLSGLSDSWSVSTLSGERVRLNRTPEGVNVEDTVRIVKGDIMGTNGVVHVLDAVLMPDAGKEP